MRKREGTTAWTQSRRRAALPLAAVLASVLLLGACATPGEEPMPSPQLTDGDVVFAAATTQSTEMHELRGSTVSGTIRVSLNPRNYVTSVSFYVDGKGRSALVETDTSAPFDVMLDTTKLADGKHYLVSRATVKSRWRQRSYDLRADFTVANGAPTQPVEPTPPPTEPGEPTPPPTGPGEPTPPPTDPGEPAPPPTPPAPGATDLRGDPNFSRSSLSSEARLWYDRYWAGLKASDQYPNVMQAAASGDLYQIGRYVNVHVTTMLTALRYTNDLALLDEVDRVMQVVRGTLRDTNGDGYLNWRWLHDPNNGSWYGDDWHEMDESIAHGFVAAVAWAYQANRDLRSPGGVDYAERADFWADYLKNDFEAKWRARSRVSASSMEFLNSYLLHTWVQYTRYFWYMGKVTGDSAYTAEAERRSARLKLNLKEVTVDGVRAYVYPWGMVSEGNAYPDLMPIVYGQYVTQAAQDLALDGSANLDLADLTLFANGATRLMMDGVDSYAPTVGGSSAIGGYPVKYSEGPKTGEQWVIYAYSPALVTADASGKIASYAKQLNERWERDQDAPRRVFMSATAFLDAVTRGR